MLVSWDKVNIFRALGISRQQNVIEMFLQIYILLAIDNDNQTVASAMAGKIFLMDLTFGQTLGSLERPYEQYSLLGFHVETILSAVDAG